MEEAIVKDNQIYAINVNPIISNKILIKTIPNVKQYNISI